MENVRKVINKVLDKSLSDISPSMEGKFTADFAALLRSYGCNVGNVKMEQDRSDDKTRISTKRMKLNEEERKKEQIAAAAAGGKVENISDANDGSSSSIFKLDIDCCEELFAYLPLVDLHSLGQTCKRMYRFTGYFVRENYKSTRFQWRKGNLCFKGSQMNGFIEFISNLWIWIDRSEVERLAEFAPKFKSVRKLHLNLKNNQVDCIKEILKKCEEIEISFGRNMLNIDLYEKILKFCTNMKHFKLISSNFGNDELKNNNWLLHEYPKLESLDLDSNTNAKQTIAKIRTFFSLNKGIRKFQINFWSFWDCRHWILDINMKLDELSLVGFQNHNIIREYIDLLNALYERGFYKHLSLFKVHCNDSSILDEILPPLTMELEICWSPLPPLDLKELRVNYYNTDTAQRENLLANNVSTIERVHFYRLNSENVFFFVGKFMKLREIKIDILDDVNSFNLATLNEERKRLVGAKSVTIYLSKTQFNQIIKISNLELVKVKCIRNISNIFIQTLF